MGYRSDIRIKTTKNGYNAIKREWKKQIQVLNENNIDYYNLMDNIEIFEEHNDIVYIGWDYLKFYKGYEEVDAIYDILEILQKREYPFHFLRIGEEWNDVEEIDNTETKKGYIGYIKLSRTMEF